MTTGFIDGAFDCPACSTAAKSSLRQAAAELRGANGRRGAPYLLRAPNVFCAIGKIRNWLGKKRKGFRLTGRRNGCIERPGRCKEGLGHPSDAGRSRGGETGRAT